MKVTNATFYGIDADKWRYMNDSDGEISICFDCNYMGKDWIETDTIINVDGSCEVHCPQCHSKLYYIANEKEIKSYYTE